MRLSKAIADFVMIILVMHWAWMVTVEGYDRWGVLGGIGGFLFSAPLLPLSPFVAWLFPDPHQIWVYYALLAVLFICFGISAFLRPRITSDYPYR